MTDALLVLEDGRTFHGDAYGAIGETVGEAVFATGMTGYQETLTDPSYRRQVVVMTAPHIGNTGVNDDDDESARMWVAGFVVRDPARRPSSWRSRRALDEALSAQQVVGISGVDTRALTRHLRDRGVMRAGISSAGTDAAALLATVRAAPGMAGANLVADVTTPQPYIVPAIGERRWRIAAIDLGIKASTLAALAVRGFEVHVLAASTAPSELRARDLDGVFLSNGPGDPAAAEPVVELVRDVLQRRLPCFGICFGHQLLARAVGFETYKLRYGHRGLNCPVLDRATGRVEITAHNHGFAVGWPGEPALEPVTTPYGTAEATHVCLNDGVVEGLRLLDDRGEVAAFSVQYHPEAAAGPHDAEHLFDRFGDLVERVADRRPASGAHGRREADLTRLSRGRPRASRTPADNLSEATRRQPGTGEADA